jgi:hypothetical protein
MTTPETNSRTLPRYGIRDDEKTRPCIVLFDWNGDDEATVRVSPLEPNARTTRTLPREDRDEDVDASMFRPRWAGVGRRPGAVALAVVLGVSVAIGVIAILGSGEAQAGAADRSSVATY